VERYENGEIRAGKRLGGDKTHTETFICSDRRANPKNIIRERVFQKLLKRL
jgi:hypothetical protein